MKYLLNFLFTNINWLNVIPIGKSHHTILCSSNNTSDTKQSYKVVCKANYEKVNKSSRVWKCCYKFSELYKTVYIFNNSWWRKVENIKIFDDHGKLLRWITIMLKTKLLHFMANFRTQGRKYCYWKCFRKCEERGHSKFQKMLQM